MKNIAPTDAAAMESVETREWIDSIDYVIDCTDAAVARFLEDHVTSREASSTELEAARSETADHTMKREDLEPAFEKTLRDQDGNVIDLTDAEITFRMRAVGADVLKVNSTDVEVIGNPKRGRIRYEWQAGDTTDAGVFDVECYVAGDPRTIPSSSFFRVEIFNSLLD